MPDDDLLTKPYVPTVVHFADSDALEYASEDAACVYERIDANCDLMRCMDTDKVIGFRLNGWS